MFYVGHLGSMLGVRKCLRISVLDGVKVFNMLIMSDIGVYRKENCNFFQKKVQKNLEDKKKSVSLQPV